MLTQLREEVCRANIELQRAGLVTLTWGNVSGLDPHLGLIAIKPSGVDYADLTPDKIVLVDLEGVVVEGTLRPSSDTPTHVRLYRAFHGVGGIAHTHSPYATAHAQALSEIACLGTTHADHFHGPVPLTRFLRDEEIADDYEGHTGTVIVERFAALDPLTVPGVLVAGHGPFTWGHTAAEAVANSVALEAVARMAAITYQLNPSSDPLPDAILAKHFSRKHGPAAYYGQPGKNPA